MCIETRGDLRFYLRADLAAHGLDRWRARYRLTNRIVYFQWLLRRCDYWEHQGGVPAKVIAAVLLVRLHLLGERLGFTIPRHVIGPGFSIAHKGAVVINHRVRIGRNFRVHQGVTVGQVGDGYPVIGDDVWIAAGAQVLGGVTVGNGAAVGANAVVVSDVAPGVTVGGIPAKVISEQNSRRWLVDACGIAGKDLHREP